jgi:hypothetical protein
MNTCKTPTTNIEEEWIVKYRAALNAAPIKRSHAARLRATWSHACSIMLSYSVKVIDKWIRWQSTVLNPTLQPEFDDHATFQDSASKKQSRTHEGCRRIQEGQLTDRQWL